MKKYQIAAFIFCILLGCVTLGSRQGTAGPAPQTVTSQEPGKGDHAVTEPSEAVLSVASKDSDTNFDSRRSGEKFGERTHDIRHHNRSRGLHA